MAESDIMATNGVIYAINSVLQPQGECMAGSGQSQVQQSCPSGQRRQLPVPSGQGRGWVCQGIGSPKVAGSSLCARREPHSCLCPTAAPRPQERGDEPADPALEIFKQASALSKVRDKGSLTAGLLERPFGGRGWGSQASAPTDRELCFCQAACWQRNQRWLQPGRNWI